MQVGLGAVLVTQVAHAQTGGIRAVQRARHQLVQVGLAAAQERLADRRRRAKQVGHQPAVTQEVADQSEVAFADEVLQTRFTGATLVQRGPEAGRQRPVVMHPCDGLHQPAVTQAQALAVDLFEPGFVGAAIVGQRNVAVVAHQAGHRPSPEGFAAQLRYGVAVNVAQELQRMCRVRAGWCDEFDQRLGVVGGDPRVREFGAQRARMGRLRQMAVGVDAQAFLLITALDAAQNLGLAPAGELPDGIATSELQHRPYFRTKRQGVWQFLVTA